MKYVRISCSAAVMAALWSNAAAAEASLGDPAGSGVIVAAVRWLEGTLLGTASIVAGIQSTASLDQ